MKANLLNDFCPVKKVFYLDVFLSFATVSVLINFEIIEIPCVVVTTPFHAANPLSNNGTNNTSCLCLLKYLVLYSTVLTTP